MQNKLNIEYPAFVYKKNSVFVANCILFNLIAMGDNEINAVANLQKSMQEILSEFNIVIKPIFEEYSKQAQ